MLSFGHLLLHHGYWFLFVYLLAVGIGLPLPADPLFILMGALVGNHRYSLSASLSIAVAAVLIADSIWYELGRFRGRRVLGLLCKLSLEPDACVRKTEMRFAKHGARALLFAKFIPGMGLLSVSLAAISGIPYLAFLLADAAGCALWAAFYLLLGGIFYRQVDELLMFIGLFSRRAGLVIAGLLTLYIVVKYFERKRFLRNLRVNRITPQQAFDLIPSGDAATFIDLRHPAEVERSGLKIAGAVVLRPDDLRSGSHEITQGREIILYCT